MHLWWFRVDDRQLSDLCLKHLWSDYERVPPCRRTAVLGVSFQQHSRCGRMIWSDIGCWLHWFIQSCFLPDWCHIDFVARLCTCHDLLHHLEKWTSCKVMHMP